MAPIPSLFELSVRRSRLRLQVLLALASLGEAYLGQLGLSTGYPASRVAWALRGREPSYREDLSLLALGLARETRRGRSRVYEITPRGRRKARSVVAAWQRRVSVRQRVADSLRVEGAFLGAAPDA